MNGRRPFSHSRDSTNDNGLTGQGFDGTTPQQLVHFYMYIYSYMYRHVTVNHTFVAGGLQTASINTLQASSLQSFHGSAYRVCFYEPNDCQYNDMYSETQLGSSPEAQVCIYCGVNYHSECAVCICGLRQLETC